MYYCHEFSDTFDGVQPTKQPQDHALQLRHCKHSIRTLDPAELTEADFIDISNLIRPEIHLSMSPTRRRAVDFAYRGHEKFPEAARGFLYYHMPMESRPLAGEIRFRTTHRADPLEFHNGRDLLLPNGLPWSLLAITLSPLQRPVFLELLLRNRLFDKIHLDSLSRAGDNWQRGCKPKNIIHDLDQAFLHDFSQYKITCHFIGETSVSREFKSNSPFSYKLAKTPRLLPFSGELQPSYADLRN